MATKKKKILTADEAAFQAENAARMQFYRKFNEEALVEWCEKNNQTEWLKKEASKTVKHKVYEKKKVLDKKGNWVLRSDRTKPTGDTIEEPITFVELKHNFFVKFMPDQLPQKKPATVKETFRDRINKLK